MPLVHLKSSGYLDGIVPVCVSDWGLNVKFQVTFASRKYQYQKCDYHWQTEFIGRWTKYFA
ncbi:hypothetical protein STEG23_003361, partial [Scotinomys teguina]